ncbi:MAG TPA: WecB/TagA/CpsF family glycosyltransferase [Planctomycetota bacterium]
MRTSDAVQSIHALMPIVDLMGFPIHAIRESACVEHIMTCVARGQGGWIVTVNLDHLRRMVHEPGYRELCEGATMLVPDGMPLIWASRLRGTPLPERVTGSNLVSSLSKAAAQASVPIFLLGGNPGAAQGAAAILTRRYPALRIAGTHCPEFGFEADPARIASITSQLRRCRPGIVYVALGSPKQEVLIDRLRGCLPSAWWVGVGISFSYLTGEVPRAPRWMQTIGMEWLHRLWQEPQRLSRRYLLHDLPFAVRLLFGSACQRWPSR